MRYVSIANVGEWDQPAADTVYEAEQKPEKTGLLDQYGTPLYRMPEKKQIGFQIVKS